MMTRGEQDASAQAGNPQQQHGDGRAAELMRMTVVAARRSPSMPWKRDPGTDANEKTARRMGPVRCRRRPMEAAYDARYVEGIR